MSLKITQQQRMSNLFAIPSSPAKVLLRLSVSESGISEPVFFKAVLAVKKEGYIFKCLSCSGLIWRRYTTQRIFLSYAKRLVRLEELKIEYLSKEENLPNVPQIRPIENFWANLKRKVYSINYRPKDVKFLMAKIRKELKFIETT
jgi:hypothetical protein